MPLYTNDGGGQPPPTYRQRYENAERMAHEYITNKSKANAIEARFVHELICLKQASSDFPLKIFCDDNDLRFSTMSGYVSDMGYFDVERRLAVDPGYKMPVTGWRVLRHLIRRGLPDDLAYDLAADYLEAQEVGVYNELGLIDATIANMKEKGEQLIRDMGLEVEDIGRYKYGRSERLTGALIKRNLGDFGYVDFSYIEEGKIYEIASLTVIEITQETDE